MGARARGPCPQQPFARSVAARSLPRQPFGSCPRGRDRVSPSTRADRGTVSVLTRVATEEPPFQRGHLPYWLRGAPVVVGGTVSVSTPVGPEEPPPREGAPCVLCVCRGGARLPCSEGLVVVRPAHRHNTTGGGVKRSSSTSLISVLPPWIYVQGTPIRAHDRTAPPAAGHCRVGIAGSSSSGESLSIARGIPRWYP